MASCFGSSRCSGHTTQAHTLDRCPACAMEIQDARARGTQAANLYGWTGNPGQRDSYIDPCLGQSLVCLPGSDLDVMGARPYRLRQGGHQREMPMARVAPPRVRHATGAPKPLKPLQALPRDCRTGAGGPEVYQGYGFTEPMRAHNGHIQGKAPSQPCAPEGPRCDSRSVSEVDSDDEDSKDWRNHTVSPSPRQTVFDTRQWMGTEARS